MVPLSWAPGLRRNRCDSSASLSQVAVASTKNLARAHWTWRFWYNEPLVKLVTYSLKPPRGVTGIDRMEKKKAKREEEGQKAKREEERQKKERWAVSPTPGTWIARSRRIYDVMRHACNKVAFYPLHKTWSTVKLCKYMLLCIIILHKKYGVRYLTYSVIQHGPIPKWSDKWHSTVLVLLKRHSNSIKLLVTGVY